MRLRKLFITLIVIANFCPVAHASTEEENMFSGQLSETSAEFKKVEKDEQENIYRYRDIYFITGTPDTKVQLSFKLRILSDLELYLGYSQLMFWELGTADSNPFRDITYNPELFYTHEVGNSLLRYASVGIEHRSNGKSELQSRSFDRVFAQFDNSFGIADARFNLSLKLFSFYDLDKTNRDIPKYTGFGDIRLTASSLIDRWFRGKTEIYLNFTPGGTFTEGLYKGGIEAGVKLRVRLFGLLPYILLQTYQGHSESLLDYDDFVRTYRAGFLL